MSPRAVSGRDRRFHSNSATTLTQFCFPPAALCVFDTARYGYYNVKPSGVQYLREGEEREFPCIWDNDPHTSLVRCTRGEITVFTCKCSRFHFITYHILFFKKLFLTTKRNLVLHRTNYYVTQHFVCQTVELCFDGFLFRLPIKWA